MPSSGSTSILHIYMSDIIYCLLQCGVFAYISRASKRNCSTRCMLYSKISCLSTCRRSPWRTRTPSAPKACTPRRATACCRYHVLSRIVEEGATFCVWFQHHSSIGIKRARGGVRDQRRKNRAGIPWNPQKHAYCIQARTLLKKDPWTFLNTFVSGCSG